MIVDISLFPAPLPGSLCISCAPSPVLGVISHQIVHLDITLLYILLHDAASSFCLILFLFLIDFLLISILMINTIIEVLIV